MEAAQVPRDAQAGATLALARHLGCSPAEALLFAYAVIYGMHIRKTSLVKTPLLMSILRGCPSQMSRSVGGRI